MWLRLLQTQPNSSVCDLASGKLSLSDGIATCSQQQSIAEGDEANEAVDEDDDDQPFTRKPFTRTMQKQERDALQKWVQCAKCAKWRKVQHCLGCCDLSPSALLG